MVLYDHFYEPYTRSDLVIKIESYNSITPNGKVSAVG